MKYPKLTLLLGTFVAAYFLHHAGFFDRMILVLNGHGYVSMLLGGMLSSSGFTAAFGLAMMVDIAAFVHPVIGAMVGGLGAAIVDISIFSLVRFTVFHEEIHRLKESWLVRKVHAILHHPTVSERVRNTLLWSFAGIVIASPLPDEFGVTFISSVSSLRPREFAVFCFLLNTIGFLVILTIAGAIGG